MHYFLPGTILLVMLTIFIIVIAPDRDTAPQKTTNNPETSTPATLEHP